MSKLIVRTKKVGEIYEEWRGNKSCYDSCKPVFDSDDLLDFARFCLEHEANVTTTEGKQCNLPDVIQWVAVETPPTVDCFYLVYDKEYGIISKALFNGEFHLIEDMGDNHITHWAELPKPPCV